MVGWPLLLARFGQWQDEETVGRDARRINRCGEPCGCFVRPVDGLALSIPARLDPVPDRTEGRAGAAGHAVVELRAEIKRLEAELWKARHPAELEERKQANPERSLAATLALIDAAVAHVGALEAVD